jgi:DNA recombination protein RmuC
MTDLAFFVVGLIAGGVVAWFLASSRASGTVTELRAQLSLQGTTLQAKDNEINSLHQQVRAASEEKVAALTELHALEDAEERLSHTFDALAGKALKSSNEQFLELAAERFKRLQTGAVGELDARKAAVESLVKPLQESLERYERQVQGMEDTRQKAYGGLIEQLRSLEKVTGSLDAALRTSQGRGLWGQLQLRRVVELAGMSEHCDFTEQETLSSETGQQRPDMIINLPGGIRIAVDAKVPLQAFLDAERAATESERISLLARHGQLVRDHINKLGAKSYWAQFDHAPDFVILYLPGESFFAVALQQDGSLLEDGWGKNVSLASPSTLIALLRGVSYGWQQERLAQNAQEISNLGKELYDRIRKFTEHFVGVGYSLGKAVDSYDAAAGSLKERLLKSAKRFKELGAATGGDLPEVETVEREPRTLEVGEPGDVEREKESNSETSQTVRSPI